MEKSHKMEDSAIIAVREANQKPRRQYLALEGLRGFAATLVVLYHIPWPNHLQSSFVRNSYLAVDLFFLMSGFVISYNYAGAIRTFVQVKDFIGRRFFRLYPLHLAVLGVFVAFEALKMLMLQRGILSPHQKAFSGTTSLEALWSNLFLLQGLPFSSEHATTWNAPSWSISSEFAMYGLFALAARAGLFRWRSLCIGAACVLAIALDGSIAWVNGTLDRPSLGLLRCVSGFSLGVGIFLACGTAKLRHFLMTCPLRVIAVLEIGGILGGGGIMSFISDRKVIFILPFFAGLIVALQTERGPIARCLQRSIMQSIGRRSYSVYLTHCFVIIIIIVIAQRLIGGRAPASAFQAGPALPSIGLWAGDLLVVLVYGLVLGVSYFTYSMIENPARRFRLRTLSYASCPIAGQFERRLEESP